MVFLEPRKQASRWAELDGLRVTYYEDLFPEDVAFSERVVRRADAWLERHFGFWPLAIRFNYRHGFHVERMAHGHGNPFLDLDHADPLPRWRWVGAGHAAVVLLDEAVRAQRAREADAGRVRRGRGGESPDAVGGAGAERRAAAGDDRPIGYVASWDHPVGKGVISSHLDAYIVQNDVMRDDLERYHGVDPARAIVTGWPQSDFFHERRPAEDFEALARRHGLDPSRPVVLVMGNTPTNTPYEPLFFERLLGWWEESGSRRAVLVAVPPASARQEVGAAVRGGDGARGAAVQPAGEADMRSLAVMLQYGACVVSNAGTILLDALVNDRPAVCVLYDEGAPPGRPGPRRTCSACTTASSCRPRRSTGRRRSTRSRLRSSAR